MQISKNYVLRTIAGDNLLVPLGGSGDGPFGVGKSTLINTLPQAAADLGEIISEFTKLGIIK